MRIHPRCVKAVALSVIVVGTCVSQGAAPAAADSACPDLYPVELVMQPNGSAASAIVACTNTLASSVWFYNTGEFVWRITSSPGGARVSQHTTTEDAVALRNAVALVYDRAVLGPETWLTVHTQPSAVRIWPDDDLSALWWTHDLLNDIVEDAVEDGAILLASQRSKVAGTLATCGIAASNGIDDLGTLRGDTDRVEKFLAAIGLTSSAGTCATSWANLRNEVDDLPTWRRGVMSLADDADFLATVDTHLSRFLKLSRLSPVL